MAANVRTDMRIPTRAAPRPPANNFASTWGSNNQFSNGLSTTHPPQKKKPPPRPPPPKFTHRTQYHHEKGDKPKKPARPAELITNIFGRKPSKQPLPVSYSNHGASSCSNSSTPSGTVSLIDLSPPGSPTLTTRSNSDGVSVDSFGSDGNSNPSVFTNSGNTSQTESGFEDDFDFFGGLSSQKIPRNDPWKLSSSQDPFSPLWQNVAPANSCKSKTVGNSDFFAFNNETSNESQTPLSSVNSNCSALMPTIIRAKPAKPPAPKFAPTNLAPTVTQFTAKPVPMKRSAVPYNEPVTLDINAAWNDALEDEPSPPMPSIPPPAPPVEYLTESNYAFQEQCQKAYGVALYDFQASQPSDLALKEGDIVELVRAINNEWIEGRVGNRQGMCPLNFIDVKVPLPGLSTNAVNALYAFTGETQDDLTFEEGAKITVLSKLSDDWLYGECNGRRGQFPANYVDRVPSLLP
ncbi:SH3 domain-containing protein 19 isoform X1 [Neodiprion virginianus]|uniref:SH3 domain-containing protein 19 isoform X1 n=2 Tax=Neodiprion virginianus TaxID=2961670 RepID=UPI001EE6EDA5|nr:SH3 domain-containing protein 19 isoform X1 [Neodiprion virginianus]